jgi:hypothetical protein
MGIGAQALTVGAAVVVVALIVALVGGGDNGGSTKAAATTKTSGDVFLTSANTAGSNPFMDSIATTPTSSTVPQATVAPGKLEGSGSTTFDGATPGLYGGTRNISSCDPQKMVDFLTQNPDLGRAWAGAQGIDPSSIGAYVATLTPVLLRADTAVTNNGYQNGVATPFQTVLQAGTAVLIDKYGIPRVRCYCGNPLSPPVTYGTPTYTGPRWTGFQPATTVVITVAPQPITVITIVDVTTGKAFGRPVGTDGTKDTNAPAASTTPPTSTTSTTTPQGTGAPGPGGNFTLRFGGATFSGTTGLMTQGACTLVGQDLSGIPVDIVTAGSTITVTSIRFELAGTYDPSDGSFTASANVPPIIGDSKVFTMTGTMTPAGTITGTYSIAVSPPAATCTFKMAGAKNA